MSTAAERAIRPGRWRTPLRLLLVVSDAAMVFAAGVISAYLRFGYFRHVNIATHFGARTIVVTVAYLTILLTLLAVVALALEGLYDLERALSGTGEYWRATKGLILATVVFVLITYALKLAELSRLWTFQTLVFSLVMVCAARLTIRVAVWFMRTRGRMMRPLLVVGSNAEAQAIVRAFEHSRSSGLLPVGFLATTSTEAPGMTYRGEPMQWFGSARGVCDIVRVHGFDTVLIVSSAFAPKVMARIITDLRGQDVRIQVASGLLDVSAARVGMDEVGGIPLVTIKAVTFSRSQGVAKRTLDLVLGTIVTVVGLPIWAVIAIAIKLDSPGPVFFRQERIGRGGLSFGMYKFRSMRVDAEECLAELQEHNEATGLIFKMKDDPRVTRWGRVMRRFSIDEFPQLINVLRGDMSLVGPRPALPSEVVNYTAAEWPRLHVPPGMTGLWQVSGRSGLTFEEMIRLDLYYIENWSVGGDVGIMVRTVPTVLFSSGAY